MSYCTVPDVAAAATGGWVELAQRASPEAAGVDATLLKAAAAGQDLSSYPPDVQAATQAALARVVDAVSMATKHIDTYLYPRYRQVMPLTTDVVQASSLPAVCASIALRRLYGASVPDEVRQGTKWADQYLGDLSKGTVSIGQPDTTAQPAGRVVVRSQPKAFDWGAY